MIKYLLEKEFKQLLRNPMLPRMLLVFPCIILLVLPWAANFEIKNMNLSIVDNDRSPYSTRLVQKVGASEYFHLIDVSNNYQEAMQCIEKGDADLILEIPPHFERDLLKTGVAKVLVSANTVNGTKGTLGSSYLSNIVNAYATEIRISHSGSISPSPVIKIDTQGRFNPYLDYKVFIEHRSMDGREKISSAVALATVRTAKNLKANAIVTPTMSGNTARLISNFRPKVPIYAITPNSTIQHKLQLIWGVTPLKGYQRDTTDHIMSQAMNVVRSRHLIHKGDLVVFTAGDPATNMTTEGAVTNMMHIIETK